MIGGWIAAEAAARPAPAPFPHGPLDDAPQPFVPNRPASAADRNRVDAMAMFAAGTAHKEREEYDVALRMYQRAFRLAPAVRDIAEAVVNLAYDQGRADVAIRYLKWTDPAHDDAEMLLKLANWVFDRGDAARSRGAVGAGAGRGGAGEGNRGRGRPAIEVGPCLRGNRAECRPAIEVGPDVLRIGEVRQGRRAIRPRPRRRDSMPNASPTTTS